MVQQYACIEKIKHFFLLSMLSVKVSVSVSKFVIEREIDSGTVVVGFW